MTSRDVFREVILPSAKLPDKASYSLPEVSRMFGITTRTLRKYIQSGRLDLTIYRFGPWPRIYRVDLVRIFNQSGVEIIHGSQGDEDTLRGE